MVYEDRRLKVRELADMVGISKSTIHRILTENLDMRKLCQRWVPRFLTMEQNSVIKMFQSSVWRSFTAIKPIFCVSL